MVKINIGLLRTYNSNLNQQKENFNSSAYSTFSSSYLCSCSDPIVLRMKNNLEKLYKDVISGYNNISGWWSSYNGNVESLENALSNDGRSGSISEGSIRNYVNSNLRGLNDYRVEFTDVFNLNFDNTVSDLNVNSENNAQGSSNSKSDDSDKTFIENVLSFIDKGLDTLTMAGAVMYSEYTTNLDTFNLIYSGLTGKEVTTSYTEDMWNDVNAFKADNAFTNVALLSLGEGGAKFFEKTLDALMVYGSALNTENTNNMDTFNLIYSGLTGKEVTHSYTEDMWNDVQAFVSEDFVTSSFDYFYENTEYGQELKENLGSGFDTTRTIAKGIGEVGANIGSAVLTVGLSGGASLGAEAFSQAIKGTMVTNAFNLGFGSGTETAWANGATLSEGLLTGAVTGSWDATQMWIGQQINNLTPFGENTMLSKLGNSIIRIGADAIDSGAEGFAQPLISLIYQDGYYDDKGNYIEFTEEDGFGKKYLELFNDSGGMTNVFIQGAIGAAGSLIGEATDLGKAFREQNTKIDIDSSTIDVINESTEYIIPSNIKGIDKYNSVEELVKAYTSGKTGLNNVEFDKVATYINVRDRISISNDIGQKLEKIFFDDDYIIGVHRTGREGNADAIMQNGLLLTGHLSSGTISDIDLRNNITFHDDYIDFLKAISEGSTYKRDGLGFGDAVIVKIPRTQIDNLEALINITDSSPVLKPEYIVGKVSSHIDENKKINLDSIVDGTTKIDTDSKLPNNIFVQTGLDDTEKIMNVGNLLTIIQNPDEFAKFIDFDNNKSLFTDGTKLEYESGIKTIMQYADENNINIGSHIRNLSSNDLINILEKNPSSTKFLLEIISTKQVEQLFDTLDSSKIPYYFQGLSSDKLKSLNVDTARKIFDNPDFLIPDKSSLLDALTIEQAKFITSNLTKEEIFALADYRCSMNLLLAVSDEIRYELMKSRDFYPFQVMNLLDTGLVSVESIFGNAKMGIDHSKLKLFITIYGDYIEVYDMLLKANDEDLIYAIYGSMDATQRAGLWKYIATENIEASAALKSIMPSYNVLKARSWIDNLQMRRSDGSIISLTSKGEVMVDGKKLYVFTLDNGKTIYSDVDILGKYYDGDLDTRKYITDTFLNDDKINNALAVSNGYIGLFDDKTISDSIKRQQTSLIDYFEKIRGNDSNAEFGVNQSIKSDNFIMQLSGEYRILQSNLPIFNKILPILSTKYNVDAEIIYYTMYNLDNTGACSYANQCNIIFLAFKDNPEAFKKTFGYDMYVEVDGKTILNSKALMTDLYLFANSKQNGGNIFDIDSNTGKLIVSATDTSMKDQIYMAYSTGINTDVINKFLNSYNVVSISTNSTILYSPYGSHGNFDINALVEDIKMRLIKGEFISMEERYTKGQTKPIIFYSQDDGRNISTLTWGEGTEDVGAHITTVVDVTDEGFIVVSWGKKYLIKFEDLKDNNCAFYTQIFTGLNN